MKNLINATITPLASIFGRGFLVIVPILPGAVGPYSVYAMIGVCALAFAVGSVIRFNIKNAADMLGLTRSRLVMPLVGHVNHLAGDGDNFPIIPLLVFDIADRAR